MDVYNSSWISIGQHWILAVISMHFNANGGDCASSALSVVNRGGRLSRVSNCESLVFRMLGQDQKFEYRNIIVGTYFVRMNVLGPDLA